MRLRFRESRALAAAAVLLTLASATGCRDAPGSPSLSTLRVAIRADVTGFFPNPPIRNEGYTFDINWLVYEGLVGFDDQMRPRPGLASRWTNPDELTYVFELRPGARFSDGRPVTPEDVAASLQAVSARSWVTSDYLQAVASVRSTGPGSVEIRTRFPYPVLLSKLPWGLVLPREALRDTPIPVIGSGPYRLESWEPGKGFTLVRNLHFSPPPAFERVEFEVVLDDDERLRRLIEGETDVVNHLPLDRIDDLEDRGLRVAHGSTMRVIFLSLRVDRAPFSDARVRRAVELALDRAELVERAYGGRTVPATQLVPPAVVGFEPDLPVTEPDRAQARALLADAGYPDGLEVRLDGPYNRYVYGKEIMAEVARQLGLVGIRVVVNELDKAAWFELIFSGQSSFHLLGWECKSGEAGEALDALIHSPGRGYGTVNTTAISDADLDRLIEEAAGVTSPLARSRLLREAMARVAELRPIVPLVIQADGVAFSRAVEWEPGATLALRVADMRPAR